MAAIAVLLVFAPMVRGATAVASVHVKLTADPTGMFFIGKPAVPIVRPHRITLGIARAGVTRTRLFGLGTGRVVFVGARARPFVLVGSPVVVVNSPGVAVGSPGVVVNSPGVVVGSPAVVVGAPAVVVGVPGVVVGVPGVGFHGPSVGVGVSPVVVVNGGGKHDNGRRNHGAGNGGGKHGGKHGGKGKR